MKHVYVAGSTRDIERVQEVQKAVRNQGHAITYDWTRAEKISPEEGWDQHSSTARMIAGDEISACKRADLTILLFPPPPKTGLGCWIEMGATLAGWGYVWVVDAGRDSVFWHHQLVSRYTYSEVIERIKEL